MLSLAVLPAAGCLSSHHAVVVDVDPRGWTQEAQVRFANADTLGCRDLWLVVRHDGGFAGGELEVEVTTTAPDSLRYTEPFTLRFAPSHAPSPLLRDTAVLYRPGVVLRCAGDYTLTIRPRETVRGVEAVGINIVTSN